MLKHDQNRFLFFFFRSIVVLTTMLSVCGTTCRANDCRTDDEPADALRPEPQPVRHRVTGMFSPDRQDDLRDVMKKIPEITLVSIDYQNSEATFRYDADRVFNKPKPDQVAERFDNLLRSVSNSTFGIRPLCTIPRDRLELIEIGVVGLDCKGCSLAAYEAVYRVEGVERATASFREGLVTALINPEKTNRTLLEEALKSRRVELK